ncbi:MAG TPA: hypothetical protein VMV98_05285 [Acidobacteriaceae bacterium]|nr:hypothetical protein [Acidobacteriaceae bacterium]
MRVWAKIFVVAVCAVLLTPLCAFAPLDTNKVGADFIVTAAPAYAPLAELRGGERFPQGAQLLLVHDGKAEPLVAGFADTADADVSFDARTVLFAGKRAAGDPWQIWELTLKDGSVRKVIDTKTDAERPFYLPGGRMVWAQRTPTGFQIESAEDGHPPKVPFLNPTAGPGVLPLTYMRASAFPTAILADGRILFESGFPLEEGATPELYLVYADGSGVESYRCDHGRARWGGSQLASGEVVFTHGSSLARFTSALAHETPVAAPRAEYAGAIKETISGAWLMSARTATEAHYAIHLWKPETRLMETVLAQRGEDLVEPVLVMRRTMPRRFPSGLHPWNYGILLTLDSRLSLAGDLKQAPASVRLETRDAEGHVTVNGTAPVAPDGSFFVKVPGDRPIRFLLLDRRGAMLRREHGWFWIRGGEQRICVGCHTGPALSPENRVPEILRRTATPFDLTGTPLHASTRNTSPGGLSR